MNCRKLKNQILTGHKNNVSEGEILKETMAFCIDDRTTGNTIFEEQIEFDETYFMNLVNKSDNDDKRQQWLLDIANELMVGIEVSRG